MTRGRTALLVGALVAWVVGSALGAPVPARTARAEAAPSFVLGLAHPAQYTPSLTGNHPLFILALGSDARPGQPIAAERSDSIHIIGINPAKHRASILGFPRDSWVNIPGHGTNKINSAMVQGGPSLTVQTLENLTGIHIDYYLLTSFGGLRSMVTAIGGITVRVPYPMHDRFSGANFTAGVHHLNGKQALSFTRDRHDVPGGDLGRSHDQGILLLAALAALHGQFQADPGKVLIWLGAGLRNVKTDLSIDQLLTFAFTALGVSPGTVRNLVVPATTGTVGGASVVFISPAAQGVYADLRDDGVIEHH